MFKGIIYGNESDVVAVITAMKMENIYTPLEKYLTFGRFEYAPTDRLRRTDMIAEWASTHEWGSLHEISAYWYRTLSLAGKVGRTRDGLHHEHMVYDPGKFDTVQVHRSPFAYHLLIPSITCKTDYRIMEI